MQIKLNKVQDLEKFIAVNEPDLILISETLPENYLVIVNAGS